MTTHKETETRGSESETGTHRRTYQIEVATGYFTRKIERQAAAEAARRARDQYCRAHVSLLV